VEQGITTTIGVKINKSESAEETGRGNIFFWELFKLECRTDSRDVPLCGILNRSENITLMDNH
jgi:hypothetical protein